MPSPDVSNFLRDLSDHNFLGADAFAYLYQVAPDTDAFIDRLGPALIGRDERPPWRSQRAAGLACEQRYIDWRARKPNLLLAGHPFALEELAEQIGTFVEYQALLMVELGFETVNDLALQFLDQRYAVEHQRAVIERSARRLHHDLDGYSKAMLDAANEASDQVFDEATAERELEIDGLTQFLTTEQLRTAYLDPKRPRRFLKLAQRRQRRAVMRSIDFAERLMGEERTRLFIGMQRLRIDGELATYQIVSHGRQNRAHGGATMTLFARGTETQLCNLCIYTPDVPLLDHVASIVMHIKAGNEEHILNVGNPYDVKPEAYDQPWLVPRLPERPETPLTNEDYRNINIAGRVWRSRFPKPNLHAARLTTRFPTSAGLEGEERAERIVHFNNIFLDRLLDRCEKYLPPNRKETWALLRTGHFSDWKGDTPGDEAPTEPAPALEQAA